MPASTHTSARASDLLAYVLLGSQTRANVREYTFQGTTSSQRHVTFIVHVDLKAALKHRIPVQEIPLLCRRLLEEKPVADQESEVSFTEERMADYARDQATKRNTTPSNRRAAFRSSTARA